MAKTPAAPIPAAQYLRVSTDRQDASLDHQLAVISRYAAQHGYRIVRTYTDVGISGLRLRGRAGLQSLLSDVLGGQADFAAILVYDVSRWGRFQDIDQGAHYEFLCRDAGVAVAYCAEDFDNNGGLSAAVLKHLRRTMAAEFSRELSEKVAAAKRRAAQRGFWQGARPGYGLRRLLVDRRGQPRRLLEDGEQKAIRSDRVVSVPGPAQEVATVRRIFALFVVDGLRQTAIARQLNAEGVPYRAGVAWSGVQVREILIAEKYAGVRIYGRWARDADNRPVRRPADEWFRGDQAFAPIVPRALFDAAQARIRARDPNQTDAQMLEALRALLAKHGRLSPRLINAATDMPSTQSYLWRFHGLRQAYARIGYFPRGRPADDNGPPAPRPRWSDKAARRSIEIVGPI